MRAAVLAVESCATLAAMYVPSAIVGVGGNGVVLAAVRRADAAPVAVKVVYKNLARAYDPCVPNEIVLLRDFVHPHAVEYIDDFEDAFHYYLVTRHCMPYGPAASLAADPPAPRSPDACADPACPHCCALPLPLPPARQSHAQMPPTPVSSVAVPDSDAPPPSPRDAAYGDGLPVLSLDCVSPAGHIVPIVYSRSSSDLHAFLRSARAARGSLCSAVLRRLFAHVAVAVAALHAHGWSHGDIKQENVLVDANLDAILCDFGHARPLPQLGTPACSLPVSAAGTTAMTPPELLPNLALRGMSPDCELRVLVSGCEADVWALGMLLFTMTHNRMPACQPALLRGELDLAGCHALPCDFDDAAPKDLRHLVSSMLAIDPANRISAADVLKHPYIASFVAA
ncbi:hypothetical protein HK105_205666 [Polyrhizophydium stewartii]|uniref:Protein kinase domain-containing protein n=1 Tax=Polyrhizophydium stewartii TaxID=2732419 RepID=A0ABR4N5K1_9FUNG|nr:hypothetical protein HK105_001136 [Polyrhizophydium stewartii]